MNTYISSTHTCQTHHTPPDQAGGSYLNTRNILCVSTRRARTSSAFFIRFLSSTRSVPVLAARRSWAAFFSWLMESKRCLCHGACQQHTAWCEPVRIWYVHSLTLQYKYYHIITINSFNHSHYNTNIITLSQLIRSITHTTIQTLSHYRNQSIRSLALQYKYYHIIAINLFTHSHYNTNINTLSQPIHSLTRTIRSRRNYFIVVINVIKCFYFEFDINIIASSHSIYSPTHAMSSFRDFADAVLDLVSRGNTALLEHGLHGVNKCTQHSHTHPSTPPSSLHTPHLYHLLTLPLPSPRSLPPPLSLTSLPPPHGINKWGQMKRFVLREKSEPNFTRERGRSIVSWWVSESVKDCLHYHQSTWTNSDPPSVHSPSRSYLWTTSWH